MKPDLIPPSDSTAEYVAPPDVMAVLERSHKGRDVEMPAPVQRAARLPDIRILRGLLQAGFPATNYIVGPLNNLWESALTNAILARLPEHAKLLLDRGANPNGFPNACFAMASTRFFRGHRVDLTLTGGAYLMTKEEAIELLKGSKSSPIGRQMADLTDAELQQRRGGRARFWAEVDFPRTDYPTNNPPSALSASTQVGDKLLYLRLVQYGADESAWIGVLPDKYAGTASSLSVEPPLWVAVKIKDIDMVRFLLDRGHKPDFFPKSLATRSWNAMAYAIATKWTAGFDAMASLADLKIVTPVYRCHLIHFAVATLDREMIQSVIGKCDGREEQVLRSVPKTALQHNLLHLASLPLDDSFVNMHSLQCYISVHDFRTLDTTWTPLELRSSRPVSRGRRARGGGGGLSGRSSGLRDVPSDQLAAQEAVIRFLVRMLPGEELQSQDIHMNTPLHYLASIRNPNDELIDWLRGQPFGDAAWSVSNSWGFSAKNLLDSGRASRSDWDKPHMPFWKRG
ncbi:hypothetical protein LQW54_003878 [Pestalotiopsis sp. IQ-011]